VAGFQVVPPSVETSTRATTAPEAGVAVPLTVTGVMAGVEMFGDGVLTATLGPVVTVDLAAGMSPACRVSGCALMSASRFTVACSCTGSSLVARSLCTVPRPQDHCTVPAPNTSAPDFGSRYSVRLCVAVPLP